MARSDEPYRAGPTCGTALDPLHPAAGQIQVPLLTLLLDRIRDAAAMLAPDGRLLHANRAARLLFATGPLVVRAGRLTGVYPEVRGAFSSLLADAAMKGSQVARLADRDGRQVIVAVTAERPSGESTYLLAVAHGCVTGSRRLTENLRMLFDLTPAEAQIAVEIARGVGTAEIARERCVAPATVRAQIKLLFAKLGCASRGEVAALVTRVPSGPDSRCS